MTSDPHKNSTQTSRESLTLTRTRLANERTMLAYARTVIMLVATGVTLLKLYGDTVSAAVSGWVLVAAATSVVTLEVTRYQKLARALR
jgi:putative membrane protein